MAPICYPQVLVNLSSLPVLAQHSSQDSLTPHPHDLGGHSCLVTTLSLTGTSVSSQSLSSLELTSAGSRVAYNGLADNLAVLDQLADIGSRVGVADVVLLGWVEPDFSLTDSHDGSGQALLRGEVNHLQERRRSSRSA